jgi:preprotein translocase subunit SecD
MRPRQQHGPSAYATFTLTQQWFVVLNLTKAGSRLFSELAGAYYQRVVANDLDDAVISTPEINSQNFAGSGQITDNFDKRRAQDLAAYLSFGALPVAMARRG